MPSIRKRKDFPAELQSKDGRRISDCHVYAEIETTVTGDQREVTWSGKITSFSDPETALRGDYLLKHPDAANGAAITVHSGAQDRLGITSDEYEFWGDGAPPELP